MLSGRNRRTTEGQVGDRGPFSKRGESDHGPKEGHNNA